MKWVAFFLLIFTQVSIAQKQVSYLAVSHDPLLPGLSAMPAIEEMPFELINGMILLEAEVNNQKGTFILDTGAPTLVLNQPVRKGDRTATARSCSGTLNVGTSSVRHFQWGNQKKYEVEALALDLTHLEAATGRKIKGLIGFLLLKDREILIDYEKQRLLLFQPGANPLHRSLAPSHTTAMAVADHLPVLELKFGDKMLRFGLDTGSESNLIDQCQLHTSGGIPADTVEQEILQGLDHKCHSVPVIRISGAEVASIPLDDSRFLATELCHLTSASGININGLLGYDFLKMHLISINYQKKEIYFWEKTDSM